jgi:hypothetical protein
VIARQCAQLISASEHNARINAVFFIGSPINKILIFSLRIVQGFVLFIHEAPFVRAVRAHEENNVKRGKSQKHPEQDERKGNFDEPYLRDQQNGGNADHGRRSIEKRIPPFFSVCKLYGEASEHEMTAPAVPAGTFCAVRVHNARRAQDHDKNIEQAENRGSREHRAERCRDGHENKKKADYPVRNLHAHAPFGLAMK